MMKKLIYNKQTQLLKIGLNLFLNISDKIYPSSGEKTAKNTRDIYTHG